MIRVTYRMSCHHHAYSQHLKLQSVDGAQMTVDENMAKERFSIEISGGYIWIYPSKVSAIEIRDITYEENIRTATLEAQRKGD